MRFLIAALLVSTAQDEKFSGPQKGEKTAGFTVFDVGARREADYVAEWKGAPTLFIFIHEFTRPGAQLMRPLDEYGQIKQVRGLRTLFVSLSEDRDGAERRLPATIKAVGFRSPVGISVDGREGPGAYGLNREVTLTILVAKGNKVLANFAILSPNETDAPKIKAAIDEALKGETGDVPLGTPEEMREEILRLREEVAALKIQAQQRPASRTMAPPAGDEKIVGMCRRLIQPRATQEELNAAVKDAEAYIAGNDERRKQYVEVLGKIHELKYGNELGQSAIKAQLEKHKK